jgi:hypothetical protein
MLGGFPATVNVVIIGTTKMVYLWGKNWKKLLGLMHLTAKLTTPGFYFCK